MVNKFIPVRDLDYWCAANGWLRLVFSIGPALVLGILLAAAFGSQGLRPANVMASVTFAWLAIGLALRSVVILRVRFAHRLDLSAPWAEAGFALLFLAIAWLSALGL
ncbi:hypothetical protein [Paracoccus sp. ME4]|uniref:hypothetical protein n=1 Tax=Paracoccus sp. ME4 TaxID=3138066 RepID=UPI00398B26BB